MSNSFDPDQDQHFVGPDLGPNCLQRLSADDKSCRFRYSFRNTIRMSNGLDPDQDRRSVGSNCLQRLTADGKSHF